MTLAVNIAQSGSNNVTFRNRIINGAVNINQRGTTNSAATDGGYWMDMYATITNQGMTFNIGQNLNSITPPAGFTNYLGCQSTSSGAVPSPTTSGVRVRIEGQNMGDLGWGAAGAQTVTMSFWVRSSLTGTFGGGMWNSSQSTSYPFSYSIPVANTWTYITITIVGPTSGTFLTTNGVGLGIDFSLATGSAQQGTAGAWTSGFKQGVTGQTQVCSTNGATWYITGLQLEAGTTASPFEYRQYGMELALCQRYYFQTNNAPNGGQFMDVVGRFSGINQAIYTIYLPVTMRTQPAISISPAYNTGSSWQANLAGVNNYLWTSAPTAVTSFLFNTACFYVSIQTVSGSYVGMWTDPYCPTGSSANYFAITAEL